MRNPRAPKRRMLRACVRACSLACVGRVPLRTHLGVGNEVAVRHASVDRALAPAVQHCAVEQSYTVATAQQCNARECSGATMQRSGMQRYNIDAPLQRRNNTLLQRRSNTLLQRCNNATLGSATAQRCNARECSNALTDATSRCCAPWAPLRFVLHVQSRCRCGQGEPSPRADVARMGQKSWCRYEQGEPSHSADVATLSQKS